MDHNPLYYLRDAVDNSRFLPISETPSGALMHNPTISMMNAVSLASPSPLTAPDLGPFVTMHVSYYLSLMNQLEGLVQPSGTNFGRHPPESATSPVAAGVIPTITAVFITIGPWGGFYAHTSGDIRKSAASGEGLEWSAAPRDIAQRIGTAHCRRLSRTECPPVCVKCARGAYRYEISCNAPSPDAQAPGSTLRPPARVEGRTEPRKLHSRRRSKVACYSCSDAHKTCDQGHPCGRCAKRGIDASCEYPLTKGGRRVRKAIIPLMNDEQRAGMSSVN